MSKSVRVCKVFEYIKIFILFQKRQYKDLKQYNKKVNYRRTEKLNKQKVLSKDNVRFMYI